MALTDGAAGAAQERSGAPDAAGPAAAIELDGAGHSYGDRAALSELSLTVGRGQTLVVFGPNGAGKSTLLRMLATLLRPTAGRAVVLGHDVPRDAFRVRGRVGLLGHDPMLYRDLSARENLRFHARLHRAEQGRIEELLDEVGLRRRADEPIRTLSRGMVQRVAACRCVLHAPELLLLDEPRANLDPAGARMLEPLIGTDSTRTRVITSHDPSAGLADADLVLGLRGGRAELVCAAGETDAGAVARLYR